MLKNLRNLIRRWYPRQLSRRSLTLPLVIVLALGTLISRVDWGGTPEVVTGRADVRDGDSLVIGRHRVRLQGIDAPERAQLCSRSHSSGRPSSGRQSQKRRSGQSWACGKASTNHLVRLIGNNPVTCKASKRDRFKRLLADCSAGGRDLNQTMVRDGMAVSFGRRYAKEEASARRSRLGLWTGEFVRPQQWRRDNPRRH